MKRPNARVTIDDDRVQVHVLTRATLVEVRDYDLKGTNGDVGDRCTDETGREYRRYFVGHDGKLKIEKAIVSDLQKFADDLNGHAGIEAVFEPTDHADGLHVLRINKVDYYFDSADGGYDGWGKFV